MKKHSNLLKMVSVRKLYKEAKMYMNFEEIQAIQQGRLRDYLDQFMAGSQIDLDHLDYNNVVEANDSSNELPDIVEINRRDS